MEFSESGHMKACTFFCWKLRTGELKVCGRMITKTRNAELSLKVYARLAERLSRLVRLRWKE